MSKLCRSLLRTSAVKTSLFKFRAMTSVNQSACSFDRHFVNMLRALTNKMSPFLNEESWPMVECFTVTAKERNKRIGG